MNIRRLLRYLFCKRLAVNPMMPIKEIWIYEWQKMPEGFRWF